jgi:hypothetical protein
MDAADRIITQLVDTICTYKWASYRVRLDQFYFVYTKIMKELDDVYTENEIKIIKERIQEYPFNDFLVGSRETDY